MSTPSKGVRGLVGLYEQKSPNSPGRPSERNPPSDNEPPPAPARFLQHPLLQADILLANETFTAHKDAKTDIELATTSSAKGEPSDQRQARDIEGLPRANESPRHSEGPPPHSTYPPQSTTPVIQNPFEDGPHPIPFQINPPRAPSRDAKTLTSPTVSSRNTLIDFSEWAASSTLASSQSLRIKPTGKRPVSPSPDEALLSASYRSNMPSSARSSLFPRTHDNTHVHHHHSEDLPPVPAKTLFSRDAQPLVLPELDQYLEKISSPRFTASSDKAANETLQARGDGIGDDPERDVLRKRKLRRAQSFSLLGVSLLFPPMELLVGTSIMDLKHNAGEPPPWKDRNSIFESLSNWVLGVTGSSAIAAFYSLQGVYDTVQIFALILSSVVPISKLDMGDQWRKLFLGTIPNVLALNFAPVLTQSMIFFVLFQLLSFGLLWYFHRSTARFAKELPLQEGLHGLNEPSQGRSWGVLAVSFVLLILYLPVSTIAVHALVWSDDFWVVENPYKNSTTFPPRVAPLGPSQEYRDPLDFCWTTTMKQESFNYAPFAIILALCTFGLMTVYFPIRLWQTTKQCLPHVDPYSDLGRLRSQTELEHEYQRLLTRDRNPLAFLYTEFRRSWGTYKSIFLLAKLVVLLTIAIIDPNNCLFRNFSRFKVEVIRQACLTVTMFAALLMQCFLAPFIDPVSNASEWTSRASYFLTSGIGLLVALDVKGKAALNGPVLYVIYGLTYGLNIYFAVMNFSWVRRLVKRLARRIDFSIDVFSPHLDISTSSVHTKRRIYQESISALLLASPDCRMPQSQKMVFNEGKGLDTPPYLLDFTGSPAERHAENLKILREVGSMSYVKGIDLCYGVQRERFQHVQEIISTQYVGPDSFWSPPGNGVPGCSHYFGNAWWIPFPPTLVIKYDSGPCVSLTLLEEFEEYASQNASTSITKKRGLRLALRALDGRVVQWPYTHTELVGARSGWPPNSRKYKIQSSTNFSSCAFSIRRNGETVWNDIQLGSGFDIRLQYSRRVTVGASVIGLDDDFNLTPLLAKFLLQNRAMVNEKIPVISEALHGLRTHLRAEAGWKRQILSYRFLSAIYDRPLSPPDITNVIHDLERDFRVRRLPTEFEPAFISAHERMRAVSRSEATTFWFILWDDFWRRNHETISALRLHETDFNPRYPSSIAYRPLPRPVLEAFLTQRGLLTLPKPKFWNFVHTGFLNKVYLRMNQIAFQGSSKLVHAHIGDQSTDLDLTDVDLGSYGDPSRFGTGGGTDHDDVEIRARPAYKWEEIFDQAARSGTQQTRWRPWRKFGLWFGISPRSTKTFSKANGVVFDVKLVQGRYIVMDDDDENEWSWIS